ncbi:hypothetical protein SEUCBS139899_008592 [Sporothrix eucalyptigena]|uniref:Chitin-binding type-4 domain-containing protein n=1 Tax=Sporothrix eucalyptigena TaxID=1812306 RepID=A0ABP0CKU8_9PEZI
MFFNFFLLAIMALLSSRVVQAHMTLASPVPFGDPTTSPLNSDGSNYPCQIVGSPATFYTASSTSSNNTMAIGATQTLSFHGSAVHGGGSCQLALTTDMQPSASTSWQVILSIEGGCPTTDGTGPSTYDYTIPNSITPGSYVFAWTWISKLSGAPEYYMNCAPVTITGGSSKRDVLEARDGNSTSSSSSSSALPNLFVANLASINSCKTTTSTDPLYPDPGPNVLKPSKMTTNYQSPSGTDCFPLGASDNSSSSNSTSSGSSSSSAAAVAPASSAVGTTLSTLTKDATSTTTLAGSPGTTAASNGTAAQGTNTGGIFVTVTTGGSGSASAAAGTTTAVAATTATAQGTTTSAAAQASASSSSGSTSSGSGLSGACTNEGTFNCVGGSQYQQCASGSWTALQAMPAGTTCQEGESTTLWARQNLDSSSPAKRFRRVRRL